MEGELKDVILFFDSIAPYYDRIVALSGLRPILWAAYLRNFISRYAPGNRLLDISIGTGLIASHLLENGLDTFGMDVSMGMLERAWEKGFRGRLVRASFSNIPFRDRTFDSAISTFDSLNTILYGIELERVFSQVYRILKRGGIFLFDMNTPYSYRTYWNGLERIDEEEDILILWRSSTRGAITSLRLDVLVRQEDGLYRRFSGLLRERGYSLDRIEKFLRRAGFRRYLCFEHMTFRKCSDNTMRFQFIAFK